MTEAERAELAALQAFVDLLGVTEMEDDDFDRWLALRRKAKAESAT